MTVGNVKTKIKSSLIFLMLLIMSVSFLYPLFYMFINAVKTRQGYFTNPFSIPLGDFAFVNFATMISQLKIFKLFWNTFVIASLTVLFILVIGIFASYAFARLEFRGKNVIYLAVIMTMFIPSQVTIIPLYVMFSKVGLVDHYLSVVLAFTALFIPEAILLMTATFKSIIRELFETAEIDGCGYFQKIFYVVIPMGKSAIFLAVIFYFIMAWNDLFTPMILIQDMSKRTVIVALTALMGRYQGSPTLQFAGLLLGAIPALLVYFIFQKQIVKGVGAGAIK